MPRQLSRGITVLTPSRARRTAAPSHVLVLLTVVVCVAAASVVAVRHVATVFAASPMVAVPLGMQTPLPRQHNWQVALAAEPALAEPEAETSEAAEVVATPTEAEADLQPEVLKNPALLFQELNISSKTEPK